MNLSILHTRHGTLSRNILLCLVMLAVASRASGAITGLEAFFRSGQTFLTWDLVGEGAAYRIYRSDLPIAAGSDLLTELFLWEVSCSSAVNARKSAALDSVVTYCVEDLVPLTLEKGLFVHTVSDSGSSYYAVTSVSGGVEDTTVVLGENALSVPLTESVGLPQPVLQEEGEVLPGVPFEDYVHWGGSTDTDSVQAMASYPGFPYNFRVTNVPQDSSDHVLRFFLHAGNSSFLQPTRIDDGAVTISPDCPLESCPNDELDKTYWFGYNSMIGYGGPLTDGVNVNYHERRILYLKDWAVRNLTADPNAVHVTGGSLGACGAVLMAIHHPGEIASILPSLPKLDFNDTTFNNFGTLEAMWGHPDDHIPTSDSLDTYERLDATWMLEQLGTERDFPVMVMFFGRYDSTMGWPEKIAFMEAAQEMRVGGSYFWDSSTHGFGGIREWSVEFAHRFLAYPQYRADRSYPAITDCSIDDDPGDGDPEQADSVGTIGGYVTWLPGSVIDEERHYEVAMGLVTQDSAIVLPADTAHATVTLRRLQRFTVIPDTFYRFTNIDTTTGIVVQEGIVKPDSSGLLSVEGVYLTVNGHRLNLTRTGFPVHADPVPGE